MKGYVFILLLLPISFSCMQPTQTESNSRTHVFFGPFSTTADSVWREDDEWHIQLPIKIDKDWATFIYISESESWNTWMPLSSLSCYSCDFGEAVFSRKSGLLLVYDLYLELQDMYWKIVLIEPL